MLLMVLLVSTFLMKIKSRDNKGVRNTLLWSQNGSKMDMGQNQQKKNSFLPCYDDYH
jgi:hypothetical protein